MRYDRAVLTNGRSREGSESGRGLLRAWLNRAGLLCVAAWTTGCASVPAVGARDNLLRPSTVPADRINWPTAYEPQKATFFVTNQIDVAAPPEAVWDVIVAAAAWPEWYDGASDVKVEGSPGGRLARGSVIAWRTMGLNFRSVVHEFQAPHRLAWESRRGDIQGYHAWLLVATPTGTRVVTEESQFGFLARMQRWFLRDKLRNLQEDWLLQIKRHAEANAAAQGR